MKPFNALLVLSVLATTVAAYTPDCDAQVRLWGTFYGGMNEEKGNKVATDSEGNVYIAGQTRSLDAIVTPNGFDTTFDGPNVQGYLAKFNTGGQLQWATYIGDRDATVADVKLDSRDNIFITGGIACPSTKLATPGKDITCQGGADSFIMRFNTAGKRIWGTYFGGNEWEGGTALSIGSSGDIYVIGSTRSPQGIAVPSSSVDATLNGSKDAFVAKFSALGQLMWSRYFGGNLDEDGVDIACRSLSPGLAADTCYITGKTNSLAGVVTAGAHDTSINSNFPSFDMFLARLNGSNGQTLWSTFSGGNKWVTSTALVVDSNLNVYVGGFTFLADSGIATAGTHDSSKNDAGSSDMFIQKFNSAGALKAGTYYGSTTSNSDGKSDELVDLAIDSSNNVFVLGWTRGEKGIATPNAFDTTFAGINDDNIPAADAVLAKFNPALLLSWATYYGGNSSELSNGGADTSGGIFVDKANHVYATGYTWSTDAMSTGSHQLINNGKRDSFLVEFVQ